MTNTTTSLRLKQSGQDFGRVDKKAKENPDGSNYEKLVTNLLANCPDEEKPAILELKTKSFESIKDRKQYKLQPRPTKFNEFDRECNVEGGEKVLAESKVPSRATPSSGCSSMASVTDLTGNFMRHEDDVTVIPVERIVSKDYGEDTRQTIGKVEWTSTFASLPLCQICILFMASK